MKKLLSLLLVLSIAVSLAVPAGAAEDATAATMRLESTEGTVTVKNSSGLSVKQQNKMRLYDGYSVKTAAKSYAYISLDGDKTLKLDASSEVSVSKSGKKLEIVLVSGSLFFNVAKPLESSESLNIRTATMVTGVRGTSACVSAPDRTQTEITLLTGRLEVTGQDSHSGQMETVEMNAGEQAVVAQVAAGTPQERLEIQKLSAQEVEVPGFAAVEVAKDPELQSKIAAETQLSVPLIIGDAEQRLAADESAAQQAAAEVQRELNRQEREQPNTVQSAFGQTSGGSGGSSGSGGGSSSGGSSGGGSSGGSGSTSAGTVDLTDPTEAELRAALNSNASVVNVKLTKTDPAAPTAAPVLKLTEELWIPHDKTLNLLSGELCNEDFLSVGGTLTVAGGACLTNTGCLDSDSVSVINVNGRLMNIPNDTPGTSDNGMFFFGTINVNSGASVYNNGQMTIGGAANLTGGRFDNNNGYLWIGGAMIVGSGAVLNNSANGLVTVTSTNSLHIQGTMENAGNLQIGGTVNDEFRPGLVDVSGTLELQKGPDIYDGSVLIGGSGSRLEISGTLTVVGGTWFDAFAVFPGGSFRIRDNASYQLLMGAAAQSPADGYYTYTNSDDPSAGAPVVFQAKSTVPTHTVTIAGESRGFIAQIDGGGSAAPNTSVQVPEGEMFVFSLLRSEGYMIQGVSLNGTPLNPDTDGKYTVGPVNGDMTVTVATVPETHTVTIKGDYFAAFPATSNSVEYGKDFAFKLTPGKGYKIDSVTCGDEVLTADSGPDTDGSYSYTIPSVTSDQTVTVTMARNLTTSTLDDLEAALNDTAVKTINLTNATLEVIDSVTEDPTVFNIPKGKTLNITSNSQITFAKEVMIEGTVTVDESSKLTLKPGTGQYYRTISEDGALIVNGTLNIESSAFLINNKTLTLSGTTYVNAGGNITNDADMTISGQTTCNDSLTNSGTLTVTSDGTLAVNSNGKLNNHGTLNNEGTVTVNSDGSLTVKKSYSDSTSSYTEGILNNSNTLIIDSGDRLIIGEGNADSSGTLNNSGTLTVTTGTLTVTNGTLSICDNGAVNTDSINENVTLKIGASGIVNLKDSGALWMRSMAGDSGATFNWDGGTITTENGTSPFGIGNNGITVNIPLNTSYTPEQVSSALTWYKWTLKRDGG